MIRDFPDKIMSAFSRFNPKICRQFDDPRIDTDYVSIASNMYLVLQGVCECYDTVTVFKHNGIHNCDIMTTEGLRQFVNGSEQHQRANSEIIFELEATDHRGIVNLDNVIVLLNKVFHEHGVV